jgi:hypothetical protein
VKTAKRSALDVGRTLTALSLTVANSTAKRAASPSLAWKSFYGALNSYFGGGIVTETKRPIWKCIGTVGDSDPILEGGGLVYIDETGAYGPEVQWFEPYYDDAEVRIYRILLGPGSFITRPHGEEEISHEWWWEKLGEVARYTGCTGPGPGSAKELQRAANSRDPMERARLYATLIEYFGADKFDQDPQVLIIDEAYDQYASEYRQAQERKGQP